MKRFLLITAILTAAAPAQDSKLEILVNTLGKIPNATAQASILKGMRDSLAGQRGVPAPKGWDALHAKLKDSPDEAVRTHAQALAVIFGGSAALGEMRAQLAGAAAPVELRRQALDALAAQRDPGALDVFLQLAAAPGPLREPALRALSGYDDPRIPTALVGAFSKLDSIERRAAVQTLLARLAGARAFTAAVDAGRIPKAELTAPLARQLDGLRDPVLSKWLAEKWGAVSAPNEDKQKLIEKFKKFTSAEAILRADESRGRALYTQTCFVCHTMFGGGGHIGPELTGGYEDVDYLLANILDPNALIGKDYQQTFVKTKDGQVLAGVVTQETATAISLKNLAGEMQTVQKTEVASTELSPLSMMPEGLLMPLDEEGVRDLFLYLRQKQQVPMLATPVNANDFFNGTDLRNWHTEGAWSVAAGALAAKGTAMLRSDFVLGEGAITFRAKATGKATLIVGEKEFPLPADGEVGIEKTGSHATLTIAGAKHAAEVKGHLALSVRVSSGEARIEELKIAPR